MKVVKIDGIDYKLNFDEATELGLVKPVFESPKIGEYYSYGENIYVLSYVIYDDKRGYGISLISIKDGSRFNNPIYVKDCNAITIHEWELISKGGDNFFKKINIDILIKPKKKTIDS